MGKGTQNQSPRSMTPRDRFKTMLRKMGLLRLFERLRLLDLLDNWVFSTDARRVRLHVLAVILFAYVLLVLGNWTAMAGEKLVFEHETGALKQLLVIAPAFVVLSGILYRMRGMFMRARHLHSRSVKRRRVMIVLVSRPMRNQQQHEQLLTQVLSRELTGEAPVDLAADIQFLEGTYWNWQQLLRAIEPHVGTVERIHLIGSGNGSYKHRNRYRQLLRRYLPKTAEDGETVELVDESVADFENLTELMDKIRAIADHEQKREDTRRPRVKERDIIIDVTGGQKTSSIAAAMVTLSSDMRFQYVQTLDVEGGGNLARVIEYDVALHKPIGEIE